MPAEGRRVFKTRDLPFETFGLDGPAQPDITWMPLSYRGDSGNGCYLFRMEAGAVTLPHTHEGVEDFLILEGDLVDDDGAVFGPGDFVSYEKGTRHNSRSEGGCLIAVFEWGKPEGR